ncbi:MAG: glycoside hydrolase family 130 protein [bacterium]
MLKRYPANPLITRADIPAATEALTDVSSVFNPGATVVDGQVHLLLRVQNRGRETYLMKACSVDGLKFDIHPEPVVFDGLDSEATELFHVYDPRITYLEGSWYITVAMDTASGCRVGLARTRDFNQFQFLGVISETDTRNAVLFPVKFSGRYLRLDRPNRVQSPGGPSTGDQVWLSASDDLLKWSPVGCVMEGRPHFWDELIGAGPPPILTKHGWLVIYHGVATHFAAANIYQAGVALLDRTNPNRVLARGRYNILEPREPYELTGQVPNVVFPSGAVVAGYQDGDVAPDEAEVRIYYGAADTVVAMASAAVGELIAAGYAGATDA